MNPSTPSHRDRVVVVTGGGTGIGLAIGRAFHDEGARVILCGRRESVVTAAAKTLGEGAVGMRADVTVESDLRAVADTARERWGRLDVWVNNAGILERGVLPEADEDHLQRTLDINVRGVFLGCRVAVEHMQAAGGVILNISSYLATHAGASATIPAYSASKGAVSALTRSLAVYHGPQGIRVNAICPALVPTELNEEAWRDAEDPEALLRKWGERYPLRRVGQPRDVASAAVFLAGDGASWITGQELYVDGGISAV